MKRKLVVGNWKMNGDLLRNRALLEQITHGVPAGVDCAVCVPFPYLAQAQTLLAGSAVRLGAQNLSEFDGGAYTGEVSASMLHDFGCRYVIVGHSERRTAFGEDDGRVARKARAALSAGLVPIVCVGESLDERDAGQVEAVLLRQLVALSRELAAVRTAQLVIAYEPLWAIGSGRAASPDQVQAVLALIRNYLLDSISNSVSIPILYGGSVKPDTAEALFGLPDSDGGLIGGASLVATQFLDICRAAERASADSTEQFQGSR